MKFKIKIISSLVFFFLFFQPAFASYDFFIDKNSLSDIEDGSEENPWKTINSALDYVLEKNLKNRKIFIKSGIYKESVDLKNSTDLFGESRENTIIDADGETNAIRFISTRSTLENLTVRNANRQNILIDKKSKSKISNCVITGAGEHGVELLESSNRKQYQFTIENSDISQNRSKGLCLFKRRISVKGNEISDNGQEGIDIHQEQKGIVSNNGVRRNGESGIEASLSKADLKISRNHLEGNDFSGLRIQISSLFSVGKISISGNRSWENKEYGLHYENMSPELPAKTFRKYADKYVKASKNNFQENRKGNIRFE